MQTHRYTGIVMRGRGRGRELGFPTANIECDDDSLSGVYAARVTCGGNEYQAAVFADPDRKILEAHLLDFSGDAYGEEIVVTLLKKVRDSSSFADDEALKEAISQDIETVRAATRACSLES